MTLSRVPTMTFIALKIMEEIESNADKAIEPMGNALWGRHSMPKNKVRFLRIGKDKQCFIGREIKREFAIISVSDHRFGIAAWGRYERNA
jgi:hypothetical protein